MKSVTTWTRLSLTQHLTRLQQQATLDTENPSRGIHNHRYMRTIKGQEKTAFGQYFHHHSFSASTSVKTERSFLVPYWKLKISTTEFNFSSTSLKLSGEFYRWLHKLFVICVRRYTPGRIYNSKKNICSSSYYTNSCISFSVSVYKHAYYYSNSTRGVFRGTKPAPPKLGKH